MKNDRKSIPAPCACTFIAKGEFHCTRGPFVDIFAAHMLGMPVLTSFCPWLAKEKNAHYFSHLRQDI
jgi:hypothetical protein